MNAFERVYITMDLSSIISQGFAVHIARNVKMLLSILKQYNPVMCVPSNPFRQLNEVPLRLTQLTFSHGHLVVAVIESDILILAVRNQTSTSIHRM